MNRVTRDVFSYFDTGRRALEQHGFVLGLFAELYGRYTVTSNRESGFGRYDVMLEPKRKEDDDWNYVLKALADKRITPAKLISHKFSLEELERGFHIMRDKSEGYIKILACET